MAMRTRITAVAKMFVKVSYTCSSCGHYHESLHELIEKQQITTASWSINRLQEELREKAEYNLKERYQKLHDRKYPTLLAEERFVQRCPQCGHREVWARNVDSILYVLRGICKWFAIVLGLVAGLLAYEGSDSVNGIVIAAVIAGAGWVGLHVWIKQQIAQKARLIAKMPPESIPNISLFDDPKNTGVPENTDTPKKTAPQAASLWVCRNCGTENSTNYGQCKKCGKFKG